ncbi:MAG: hypothetical protein ACYC7A_11170 [Thermoanaerobaculia bacterium]
MVVAIALCGIAVAIYLTINVYQRTEVRAAQDDVGRLQTVAAEAAAGFGGHLHERQHHLVAVASTIRQSPSPLVPAELIARYRSDPAMQQRDDAISSSTGWWPPTAAWYGSTTS